MTGRKYMHSKTPTQPNNIKPIKFLLNQLILLKWYGCSKKHHLSGSSKCTIKSFLLSNLTTYKESEALAHLSTWKLLHEHITFPVTALNDNDEM